MKHEVNILFDVDGVLLDTMSIWADSANRYLKEIWDIDAPEDVDRVCASMSLVEAGTYLKSLYPQISLEAAELADGVAAFIRERYVKAPAMAHMPETIRELKNRGYHLFLATASDEENVKGALKNHGVWDCFLDIYTCTRIGYSKQYVEYYQKIAEHIGADCKDLIMVEDSLHSVITAKKAGLKVIGIREPHAHKTEEEMRRICDIYMENLGEFRQYLF